MWRLSQVMWKWSLLSLCSGKKWCRVFEVFWYLWNDVCWPCYKPSYPLQETRCWAALVLCWWLSAPIRIDTQTPTSGQRPPWPWLSSCWSGMFLDICIPKISIHVYLEMKSYLSLVKKKITLYKKGLQAFQIFKFINTLYLSMTIVCILSKVSLTTNNNQVWSFAIQKYPFLSVVVYFPAQSSVRVTFSCCSLFWRNRLTPQYEPTQSLLLGILRSDSPT